MIKQICISFSFSDLLGLLLHGLIRLVDSFL